MLHLSDKLLNYKEYFMFERLEIRKAANGFVLSVDMDDVEKEYVFDSQRKLFKFIKDLMEAKIQ